MLIKIVYLFGYKGNFKFYNIEIMCVVFFECGVIKL